MLINSVKKFHTSEHFGAGAFQKSFNKPKLQKVIVHRCLGTKAQDNKILKQSIEELRLITGQQPVITRAKQSIAPFKIRAKMPLGLKVTLRNERMYSFVDRLVHLVLPQVKDFQGLSSTQFDNGGNYHLGLIDQTVFPEIQTSFTDLKLGLDITIVTNLTSKIEAQNFLTELGFPFKSKN